MCGFQPYAEYLAEHKAKLNAMSDDEKKRRHEVIQKYFKLY
jgi:hypothetical protein